MHRDCCLSLQNEISTPYGAAYNATAHPDDGNLQQEMVDALANLSTAMASDSAAISQLAATMERLTAELITVNTKLVAALQPQQSSQGGRGGQSRGRRDGATTPTLGPPTSAVLTTRTNNQDLEPPIHYCWTCGPGCRHNSAKCPAYATVHIYTATKWDMQGGAEAQK